MFLDRCILSKLSRRVYFELYPTAQFLFSYEALHIIAFTMHDSISRKKPLCPIATLL